MGNQQAHRAVNEQVAGRGRRRSRAAAVRVAAAVAACNVGPGRGKNCRLVAWREDRSSRQVLD